MRTGRHSLPDEVAGLDAGIVSKLYDVARKLCGVSERDVEESPRFSRQPSGRQLFRVALALGVLPHELERRVTHQQLMEWAAFERVSGPLLLTERVDYAAAYVAYITALRNGVKVKGRAPRFRDFVIDWDRKEPSEADIAARSAQYGGSRIASIATLVVDVIGNTVPLNAGPYFGARFHRQFGGTTKVLMLGAGAAVAGLAVVPVKAASDLGESMNKAKVVFGDAQESVISFSETTAEVRSASRKLLRSMPLPVRSDGSIGGAF